MFTINFLISKQIVLTNAKGSDHEISIPLSKVNKCSYILKTLAKLGTNATRITNSEPKWDSSKNRSVFFNIGFEYTTVIN
ncbi:hypothetical protein HYE36_05900 [Mycoplasmopsis bovis]|nr:hypothetical protein [Mycoplasmopsis bovis]WHL49553.1 hypothetical protein HYE36_05900 [Mycoplasmopsis bovis]